MYRTMTESIPGQRTSGSLSPLSDDASSPFDELASSEPLLSCFSGDGFCTIPLVEVSVLAIGMVKWRSQKATSLVSLDASLHESRDFSASSSWADAALNIPEEEGGTGGRSSPLVSSGTTFGTTGLQLLFDSGCGAVPGGGAGAEASFQDRFRAIFWPKWRLRRSAVTAFHELSISVKTRIHVEVDLPVVARPARYEPVSVSLLLRRIHWRDLLARHPRLKLSGNQLEFVFT